MLQEETFFHTENFHKPPFAEASTSKKTETLPRIPLPSPKLAFPFDQISLPRSPLLQFAYLWITHVLDLCI